MKYQKPVDLNLSTDPAPYVSPIAKIVGLQEGQARVGEKLEVLVDYPPYNWSASKEERKRWGNPIPTRFSVILDTPNYINAARKVASIIYDPLAKSARAVFPIVPLEPGSYRLNLKFFDEENWRGNKALNLRVI
jgi:hypothetical protein